MTVLLRDDAEGIARAGSWLRAGRLVAFATETVYGLGADATNADAIARIYAAKGRPRFNPLICHFAEADGAFAHVRADARARALAAVFWPGPLTLVLPRREDSPIAALAAAGLPSLAVRVPAHGTARALLNAAGTPIAAPSANRSGHLSPTTAAHVMAGLAGRIDAVLESGPTSVGLESSILDLTTGDPTLLRPGGIPIEMLEELMGPIRRCDDTTAVIAPGMLRSHYAPRLPLRLEALAPDDSEAWLGFGTATVRGRLMINLSPRGSLIEAAAGLFEALHRIDTEAADLGLQGIAVAPIPRQGLGAAINDRLARAAAPRG
ncbi:L-threonylcarbamoyladenylate synthase [Acidiphilium sp.]|uniref:L-threonylcarbamoyladenylate synthase n=1 Tax=Acidiphilium sp. TaxID=527 RepID=UPI003D037EB6